MKIMVPSPHLAKPIDHGPGAIVIDADAAMYHIERVKVLDPEAVRAVRAADPGLAEIIPEGATGDDVRALRAGFQQLVGRADMHLKLCALGARTIVHRDPEAFLHPKWCCALGDLFIGLDHETHR